MSANADPGFVDPDHSDGFEAMLAGLDHFDAAPYIIAARRQLYRLLRPRPGMRILDAGCGTGRDIAHLAPFLQPGGAAVGVDISSRFLEVARKRFGALPGLTFEQGGLTRLDFEPDSFDAAFSMRTVQYLERPEEGISELVRVTRPGGRVVVIEGGLAALDLPESRLHRDIFGPRSGLGTRLPNLLKDAGLVRVGVLPAFGFDYGPPDPLVQEYATNASAQAVEQGSATAAEAQEFLAAIQAQVAADRWFSVDCVFVVYGTVPRRRQTRGPVL